MYTRHEMLDVVVVDGHAKGIIVRNLVTGETRRTADCVVLATGGYGNVFYLSTNAQACNDGYYRAHKRGAGLQSLSLEYIRLVFCSWRRSGQIL